MDSAVPFLAPGLGCGMNCPSPVRWNADDDTMRGDNNPPGCPICPQYTLQTRYASGSRSCQISAQSAASGSTPSASSRSCSSAGRSFQEVLPESLRFQERYSESGQNLREGRGYRAGIDVREQRKNNRHAPRRSGLGFWLSSFAQLDTCDWMSGRVDNRVSTKSSSPSVRSTLARCSLRERRALDAVNLNHEAFLSHFQTEFCRGELSCLVLALGRVSLRPALQGAEVRLKCSYCRSSALSCVSQEPLSFKQRDIEDKDINKVGALSLVLHDDGFCNYVCMVSCICTFALPPPLPDALDREASGRDDHS